MGLTVQKLLELMIPEFFVRRLRTCKLFLKFPHKLWYAQHMAREEAPARMSVRQCFTIRLDSLPTRETEDSGRGIAECRLDILESSINPGMSALHRPIDQSPDLMAGKTS